MLKALRWAGRGLVAAPCAALGYATYCAYFPPKVAEITESCCVVTGASTGIGVQIVKTLAGEGIKTMVIAARSKDGLEKTKSEVLKAHPSANILVVPTDVCDPGARKTLLEKVSATPVRRAPDWSLSPDIYLCAWCAWAESGTCWPDEDHPRQ